MQISLVAQARLDMFATQTRKNRMRFDGVRCVAADRKYNLRSGELQPSAKRRGTSWTPSPTTRDARATKRVLLFPFAPAVGGGVFDAPRQEKENVCCNVYRTRKTASVRRGAHRGSPTRTQQALGVRVTFCSPLIPYGSSLGAFFQESARTPLSPVKNQTVPDAF